MPRVQILLPDAWAFTTEIAVRVTDINYGNHMGNDALLGILHEARMRWLRQYGWTELLFDDVGLIMVDIAVRLKSQAAYGDVLSVKLAPANIAKIGFDLIYHVTQSASGAEVARAQTGMIFFDYAKKKMTPMPEAFKLKVTP
jgi:acyl-CoA thioester hydrolase